MDKKTLQSILSKPFVLADWQNLLTEVFGVKNFLQKPASIPLASNKKAESAFELGSFNTADDRIIGLYLVKVKPEVWLERNKVGLRELLRSVYKYDVDGALIVFEQSDKWRLSFISEIRTFDEEGNITKKVTEPKRYTYLLGKGEKTKTPVDRLFSIAGKKLYLEEIRNAFSVEALNEEFYKIVARHFYQLVGATEGKGAKAITYDRVLNLPIGKPSDNAAKKIYQEFAVRLIGRTVFCWFLKVKKSDEGISLLPEHLLSSEAVKRNSNYYHSILEKLFFQTLNTPMPERWKNLPDGCEQIPFLNGGLFEPQTEDYYKPNKTTGFFDHINTLKIPDEWFKEFFENLEQYNFTIDENSVVDIEVSVDPEMLGRIFENLLAEIDPDSGETARKATGSFYTPREIVDYMATESLVLYLHNQTQIDKELLKPIFKIDSEVSFTKSDSEKILQALDRLKILDPACGSGAFPMGVLQKIVMALQKLDRNAEWWVTRQVAKNTDPTARKAVKEKLLQNAEYARKIGIIQSTLYGVDIQPIAAEISKLRCFLTLVVDENIDESKPNRGVEPLPNLEFKFVTADALLKLPDEKDFGGLFNSFDDLEQLKQIRLDYLQSYGEHKNKLKAEFKRIQDKISKQQIKSGVADVNSRAFLISSWNPFSNEKVDWFDPSWMYGVNDFDIVIGNPPYVLLQNTSLNHAEQEKLRKQYKSAQYKTDLYHLFIEQGIGLAKKENGILCYITPNTFLKNKHNDNLRKILVKETHIEKIIRFAVPIFKNASVDNSIIISQNGKEGVDKRIFIVDVTNATLEIETSKEKYVFQNSIEPDDYLFDFDTSDNKYISRLKPLPKLKQFGRAYFGIQTFDRTEYVSKDKLNNHYVPVVDGANVTRYFLKKPTEYVCFEPNAIKSGGNPAVYDKERILVRQIGKFPEACFCPAGIYTLNTIYNIYTTNESYNLKFILGIINSKLVQYYWIKTFFDNKETFPKIKKEPLESIPIAIASLNNQLPIVYLVDYILLLKALPVESPINEHVPNSHLVLLFEEVIDALVYELYFEGDFKKAGIEFMKYAQRDFKSIEGKGEKEAIEIIHKAYQTLREKNNEIRQNLKLMDTRLADLIMPIKTAK